MLPGYRGRLAPSPTGYLHPGHLATFLKAHERCRERQGTLLYRMEDLDPSRCKPEYDAACLKDLKVFLDWDEGPEEGGPAGPYRQSERLRQGIYLQYWKKLRDGGFIYPCPYSRKQIQEFARSTAAGRGIHGEQIYPAGLRNPAEESLKYNEPSMAFRFRVDDRMVSFFDVRLGELKYHAGRDFGDFLIWSADGYPSYEFAVVVDDHLMQITEVVRGEDLLLSTARQLLVYEALGWQPPDFYHCPLVRMPDGRRLSKRKGSTTLRGLMESGWSADKLIQAVRSEVPHRQLMESLRP